MIVNPKNGTGMSSESAKIPKPVKWKVLLFADGITPMEFIIALLVSYFNKNPYEAHNVASDMYTTGLAVVGVYTMEVAETKQGLVNLTARQNRFPLRVMIEPDVPK